MAAIFSILKCSSYHLTGIAFHIIFKNVASATGRYGCMVEELFSFGIERPTDELHSLTKSNETVLG